MGEVEESAIESVTVAEAKAAPSEAAEAKAVPSEAAAKAVASHYNAVPQTSLADRSKSAIFFLRNFNNWVKSQLINDGVAAVRGPDGRGRVDALDLCCGKGGDLLKWKIAHVNSLFMSDIADVSLKQAEERYRDMRAKEWAPAQLFPAHFLAADATRKRLRDVYESEGGLKAPPKFNLVSCQFAIHYSFESEAQARRMVENVADNLEPGGVFIGTTTDSNLLISQLRKRDGVMKNPVSEVRMSGDLDSPALFGASYHFKLDQQVDVPEFLLHFPLLVRLLAEQGIRLVFKKSFAKYLEGKQKDRDSLSLLSRMSALEAYPAEGGAELEKAEEEYAAAAAALAQREMTDAGFDTNSRIGTLSRSEWDVACLYIVFMFRKDKAPDKEEKKEEKEEEEKEEKKEEDEVKAEEGEPIAKKRKSE